MSVRFCSIAFAALSGCLDWNSLSSGSDAGASEAPPPAPCAAFVVAGDTHTCARFTNGSVQCWGDNRFGQLGSGDTAATHAFVPVNVTNASRLYLPTGVADISSDRAVFTCALDASGALSCWGDNRFGQLGDGTTEPHASPSIVKLPSVLRAAPGAGHVCAQVVSGDVYCWGTSNYGQSGNTAAQSLLPTKVEGLTEPIDGLVAGAYHTCAKAASGALYCWGANDHGQIGNVSLATSSSPVRVPHIEAISRVVAGAEHTCVIDTKGAIICFGDNRYGQLGAGDTQSHDEPVTVALPEAASQVYPGRTGTCALLTGGALYCWGGNANGELGTLSREPVVVPTKAQRDVLSRGVTAASLGGAHACAVRSDGTAFCWGNTQYGQLGPNAGSPGVDPVSVFGTCHVGSE